jgi:hypothetical protein
MLVGSFHYSSLLLFCRTPGNGSPPAERQIDVAAGTWANVTSSAVLAGCVQEFQAGGELFLVVYWLDPCSIFSSCISSNHLCILETMLSFFFSSQTSPRSSLLAISG